MQPEHLESLVQECTEDLEDRLIQRSATAAPGTYGAGLALPDLAVNLESIVSGALDLAVIFAGPTLDRLVADHHDAIRALVSDRTLAFIDGLIHDLQAPRPVP